MSPVPQLPEPIERILNSKALQKIRFGGIAGKLALIALFGESVAVTVGWRTSNPTVETICVVGGFTFALLIAIGILVFAFKHPSLATLEGSEVIALQHQSQQILAKGMVPQATGSRELIMEGIPPATRREIT